MRRLPQAPDQESRQVPLRWLEDRAHYDFALSALSRAQHSLWIATANLKDVRLEAPIGSVARGSNQPASKSILITLAPSPAVAPGTHLVA